MRYIRLPSSSLDFPDRSCGAIAVDLLFGSLQADLVICDKLQQQGVTHIALYTLDAMNAGLAGLRSGFVIQFISK